jgi:hypothetical protein
VSLAPVSSISAAVRDGRQAGVDVDGAEKFRALVTVPGWAEFPGVPTLFQVDTTIG